MVGVKAQNDIMKLLTLMILRQLKDEFLIQRQDQIVKDSNYPKYCIWAFNLILLTSETSDPLGQWKLMNKRLLTSLFPKLYYEDDGVLNCTDTKTFMRLIELLSQLTIDQNFIEAYSTSCGDIHEGSSLGVQLHCGRMNVCEMVLCGWKNQITWRVLSIASRPKIWVMNSMNTLKLSRSFKTGDDSKSKKSFIL